MEIREARVLVVDGDAEWNGRMRSWLENAPLLFEVETALGLGEALARLERKPSDIVLLTLELPDSPGPKTYSSLRACFPELPLVVLTRPEGERLGLDAVRMGAEDSLVKGGFDEPVLARVLLYALETNTLRRQVRNLSLVDGITGVYNRRGFVVLSEQQFKLAQRRKKGLLLMAVGFDNHGQVKKHLGPAEADRAVEAAAKILKGTFRESDILARLREDVFAVLAIDAAYENAEVLMVRLVNNLRNFNAQERDRFRMSLSMGFSCYDPDHPAPVEELLTRAEGDLAKHRPEGPAS